jgi:MFS family permease
MRGKIVSIQQLSIMSGIMVQFFVSFGFAQTAGDLSWRAPFGLMAIPGAMLGSIMLIFPESPRWLMDRDRNEEALQILGDVHAAGDTEDALVRLEYNEIRKQIDFDRTQAARSYKDLFAPDVRLRVLIGMSDQMWSQLSGMVRPARLFARSFSGF